MTFAELKARVAIYLGRSNSRIGDYINERQKHICRSYNYSFLFQTFPAITTADGTASYALPTGFKDDAHTYWTDSDGQNRPLLMVDRPTAWERYGTTSTDKGEPAAWSMEATTLTIWPTPDDAYTIKVDGFGYLADLSADADHNVLTDEWPELLIAGALADCYAEVQMTEDSMLNEQKFAKFLRDLRVADVERSLAGVTILEPRTGPYR
jgi:hypothetical protein